MKLTLLPLSDYFKESSAYWGENSNWLVATCLTRDSDCLTRSNYIQFIKELGGEGTEGKTGSCEIIENQLAIEEARHWACRWIQYLIINPDNTNLTEKAKVLLNELNQYPVLNEQHFSELESEEANNIWTNCYSAKERIEYIRKNFDYLSFHSFSDLLASARGKYFCGTSSDILY